MATRKQISEEFNKMLDILLNPVRKKLRAEFRRVQKKALKEYFENRTISNEIWLDHEESLAEIAYTGFMQSQKAGAMRQLRLFVDDKIISDDERKFFFKDVERGFDQFARREAANSAAAMAQTSKEIVQWLIEKHTEADRLKELNGILDIIREARKEALERSIWRSFVGGLAIVHGGANKGQFDSADKTEEFKQVVFLKVWITKQDSKVRDTHRPMQGKSIKKGELFKVPRKEGGFDLMKHPGDRSATIGNWINCRCTLQLRKEK